MDILNIILTEKEKNAFKILTQKIENTSLAKIQSYPEFNRIYTNKLLSKKLFVEVLEAKKGCIVIKRLEQLEREELQQVLDMTGEKKRRLAELERLQTTINNDYQNKFLMLESKYEGPFDSLKKEKTLERFQKAYSSWKSLLFEREDFYNVYSRPEVKEFLMSELASENIDSRTKEMINEIYDFLSFKERFGGVETEEDFKKAFNQFYFRRKFFIESKILNEILIKKLLESEIPAKAFEEFKKMILQQDKEQLKKTFEKIVEKYKKYFAEKNTIELEQQHWLQKVEDGRAKDEEDFKSREMVIQLILKHLISEGVITSSYEQKQFLNFADIEEEILYMYYLQFSNQDKGFEEDIISYFLSKLDAMNINKELDSYTTSYQEWKKEYERMEQKKKDKFSQYQFLAAIEEMEENIVQLQQEKDAKKWQGKPPRFFERKETKELYKSRKREVQEIQDKISGLLAQKERMIQENGISNIEEYKMKQTKKRALDKEEIKKEIQMLLKRWETITPNYFFAEYANSRFARAKIYRQRNLANYPHNNVFEACEEEYKEKLSDSKRSLEHYIKTVSKYQHPFLEKLELYMHVRGGYDLESFNIDKINLIIEMLWKFQKINVCLQRDYILEHQETELLLEVCENLTANRKLSL